MLCVPAGVPGSHKSNVVLPPHYVDLSVHIDSAVRKVPAAAGDCIIFTEGLTHGAVCLALPELQHSNERYRGAMTTMQERCRGPRRTGRARLCSTSAIAPSLCFRLQVLK